MQAIKAACCDAGVGLLLRPLTDIVIMSIERAHSLGWGQRAAVQCADSSLYLRLWVVTIPCCGGGGSPCWRHQVVLRQAIKLGLQRSADLSIEGSLLTKLHVGEGFVDKCPNYNFIIQYLNRFLSVKCKKPNIDIHEISLTALV